MWRDVSGTVGGGGSNGRWTVVSSDSYKVTLKAGCQGYRMSGVTGLAGAYDVGARTWPQLIGCALAQEPGVLNFGLRVANNGGR